MEGSNINMETNCLVFQPRGGRGRGVNYHFYHIYLNRLDFEHINLLLYRQYVSLKY